MLKHLELLFELLVLRDQRLEFLGHVDRAGGKMGADGGERGLAHGDEIKGSLAGDSLDAAGPGRDGAFRNDLHQGDLRDGADMGASAQFAAVAPDVDDADDPAVFVAEEGERALRLLVELGLVGEDLGVIDDLLIHQALDLLQLGVGHRLKM